MEKKDIWNLFMKAKANYTYIYKLPETEIEVILELWKTELKNCKLEDVNRALTEHMRKQGTFFPTVADLLKYSIESEEIRVKNAVAKFRE